MCLCLSLLVFKMGTKQYLPHGIVKVTRGGVCSVYLQPCHREPSMTDGIWKKGVCAMFGFDCARAILHVKYQRA